MDAAVVELDALTNAIRPRSQDDDLGTIAGRNLAVVFPCRVVIRRVGFELGATGIYRLICGEDTCFPASGTDSSELDLPQVRKLFVAESMAFGPAPVSPTHGRKSNSFETSPFFRNHQHLVEEPRVNLGRFVDLVDRLTPTEHGFEFPDPFRRTDG